MSPVTCPQTPSLTWLKTCAVLQITLKPGASVKRAASALHKLASGNELKGHLTWTDRNQYEHEVASLQRFLVDASVSGGGLWTVMTRCLNTCNALFLDAPVPWRSARLGSKAPSCIAASTAFKASCFPQRNAP